MNTALLIQTLALGVAIAGAVLALAAAADRIGNRVWPKGGAA